MMGGGGGRRRRLTSFYTRPNEPYLKLRNLLSLRGEDEKQKKER